MTEKTTTSFAAHAKDAQWGKDLRPYFAYRDLGIKDATEGKVLAHIIRAEQPCDGPLGYHSPCAGLPDGLPDQRLGAALL